MTAGTRGGKVPRAATGGDADLAVVGSLLAEPARARILLALLDGRALPAGVLASEAGVAASTASGHLGRLVDGGFLLVEHHGRHRYYRLAGAPIADALERLAQLAPVAPVRSLRDDTRAHALRRGRTCYDHLAGELGVALLAAFVQQGALVGHDASFRPGVERLSAPGPDICYQLTDRGHQMLADLGLGGAPATRRPLIRHCVDWSEQRHHLAGDLGARLTEHFFAVSWIRRGPVRRSVVVTPEGAVALTNQFGFATARFT